MRTRLGPILATLLLLGLGWATVTGYLRGGQDFRVFHYAGSLAWGGRWDALYTEGPDRYLYAPGFAFLIAPLGALPFGVAHAIWLAAILAAFVAALLALSRRYGMLATSLGALFFSARSRLTSVMAK